ncbi:LysR family transcriptional regulator [Phenylobacterium sp.]|jgi:DNA-binding transcriptional LysR family regulator|uniref:LysR family transcriptional regulator n=1 Tax=Phenylobacterium sp. TaxID=1871053 RepID=UPI002E30BAD7|nr:LysR family transcriptional regulator [Phenylobacterium sp.]HEX4712918.1 LysR family transcriptional regulator [Phenylobacterium sp.]
MNWRSIDLNLLVVFDAVMRERSVTRAGRLIGMSQPAMSHALNRLRHMLGDELFVRTPDGMAPTPRAERLAQPLRNALSEVQFALEPPAFDPQVSERSFAVALNNFAAVVLGPPLVTAACGAGPGMCLDMRPSGTLDVAALLDRGDIDLAIGALESPGERFVSELLLEDPFVLVTRCGHPAGRRKLSAEVLAELPYLEISSSGEDAAFLDRWLDERGLTRRIIVRAPYLSACKIVANCDLVAVFSRRLARAFVRDHPLEFHEPDFDSPKVRTSMLWHRRLDHHPAHRWLRDRVTSTCRALADLHDQHLSVV